MSNIDLVKAGTMFNTIASRPKILSLPKKELHDLPLLNNSIPISMVKLIFTLLQALIEKHILKIKEVRAREQCHSILFCRNSLLTSRVIKMAATLKSYQVRLQKPYCLGTPEVNILFYTVLFFKKVKTITEPVYRGTINSSTQSMIHTEIS